MIPPIRTVTDFANAAASFEATNPAKPIAVVLPASSRFAATSPAHLCGLAVAFDAGLLPHQALFFADHHQFSRYTSQIPASSHT
jgi:hypothetical protein